MPFKIWYTVQSKGTTEWNLVETFTLLFKIKTIIIDKLSIIIHLNSLNRLDGETIFFHNPSRHCAAL